MSQPARNDSSSVLEFVIRALDSLEATVDAQPNLFYAATAAQDCTVQGVYPVVGSVVCNTWDVPEVTRRLVRVLIPEHHYVDPFVDGLHARVAIVSRHKVTDRQLFFRLLSNLPDDYEILPVNGDAFRLASTPHGTLLYRTS